MRPSGWWRRSPTSSGAPSTRGTGPAERRRGRVRGRLPRMTSGADRVVDMIIVGTGAGGLTAALLARSEGLDVLVLEKAEYIGGTSAWSGGVIWAPDNHLMHAAGVPDSARDGLAYLEAVVGDGGPSTTTERKRAYVETIPEMLRFLEQQGMQWVYADGAIDYYPEMPGGMGRRGRSINARMFDTRELGDWEPWFRPQKEGAV